MVLCKAVDCFEAVTGRASYCSSACRHREWRRERRSTAAGTLEYTTCSHCTIRFLWFRSRAGQERLYCSSACSQAAYRARVAAAKAEEDARKERERERRRERAQQERRARQEHAGWEQRSQDRASAGGGTGAGGGNSWAGGATPLTRARALVFELAGLADDGRTTVRKAYRRAAMLLHPDQNPDGQAAYLRLDQAAVVLKRAGLL